MLSSVCNENNEFEVYIKIDSQARRIWHIFFSGPNCYKSGVYVYIIGATYGGLISGPYGSPCLCLWISRSRTSDVKTDVNRQKTE